MTTSVHLREMTVRSNAFEGSTTSGHAFTTVVVEDAHGNDVTRS